MPKKGSKQSSKRKRKLIKIHVNGYWRVAPKGYTYYVKPYNYKRRSQKGTKHRKHVVIRLYPGKKIPPVMPGYVLERHYDISEPEERITYTYKIEALVEYTGRYVSGYHTDNPLDPALKGQRVIEYYHTKFEPTIKQATVDFHELIPLLEAYGHLIEFFAIDLYRVSGVGTLKEKNWKLLKSFDSPNEVK
jgi:hypothetical protein